MIGVDEEEGSWEKWYSTLPLSEKIEYVQKCKEAAYRLLTLLAQSEVAQNSVQTP